MSLRPPRPGEPGFKDWLELADAVDNAGILGAGVLDNADMAKTNKERQEEFRARKLIMEGMTEVRGIFLPPDRHAELKELAKKLLAEATKPPAPTKGDGR